MLLKEKFVLILNLTMLNTIEILLNCVKVRVIRGSILIGPNFYYGFDGLKSNLGYLAGSNCLICSFEWILFVLTISEILGSVGNEIYDS